MVSREFHDLSELALNSHGQSWGNLGYWENGEDCYSQACKSLAMHLGKAAALDQNSVIFDAGFGCGDQLGLWLDHFRARDICGINISESQTQYARSLLYKLGHDGPAMAIRAENICAFDRWTEVIGGRDITHIVALDCAYHFPSRSDFFAHARSRLDKGGKLALTDFILTDRAREKPIDRFLLSLMFRISRIPQSNMADRNAYEAELETIGFQSIQMNDISQPVMEGFANWVRSRGREQLPLLSGLKYRVTGAFLRWAYSRSILRYVLIVAEK